MTTRDVPAPTPAQRHSLQVVAKGTVYLRIYNGRLSWGNDHGPIPDAMWTLRDRKWITLGGRVSSNLHARRYATLSDAGRAALASQHANAA